MPEKFIIDVDTGTDDAQALMLALSRSDVDVVAVTCVSGNTHLDPVCINTLKVLKVCNRLDIPVYKGAETREKRTDLEFHGDDGLSNVDIDIQVSLDQLQREHAVNAMIRLVNEYPGELTLVALAPLTNVALAIRQDPKFGEKLKRIIVMGGNTEGRGNISLCAEFNFYNDPEAAHIILEEMNTKIIIVPFEINLNSATGQSWEWFSKWIETGTQKGMFNRGITKIPAAHIRRIEKLPIYSACDLNAMAVAVDPSIVTGSVDVYATVELHGTYTRGMMVIDWRGVLSKKPNVTLINSVDTRKTRIMFEDMLK